MNTDRIKQILGVDKSKKSVNTDIHLKVNIENKERLLPPDEINHIVNVGDRFNSERQQSKFYRILGTINPTISNSLFNLDNPANTNLYTWAGFNNSVFVDNITYSQSIKNYLIERDGWFGYIDPNKTGPSLCGFIDMEPKRERFSFVPDTTCSSCDITPVKNWQLTITYPKTTDKTHNMVSGGLLIVEAIPAVVSTRNMVAFGMGCLHNLIVGSSVFITGTTGFDGEHVVVRTGLDNGDLKDYYFVIDLPLSGNSISYNSRMKRVFGGVKSEYYFRKFRKVKTKNTSIIEIDDYETYKLAFSQNIYNDAISQFVFNEDIDISDLTDNLGRPLSELYLTIVKTHGQGLFGDVSSGIETPFIPTLNNSDIKTYLKTIPAINKIHNGGLLPFPSHSPLETNITINNYDYYGDLVEYNTNEVKEIILADVSHRFNTLNRETAATLDYVNGFNTNGITTTHTNLGPRQEGYFYKAHNLIKIREYSSYVEQGDKFTEGIPSYAVNLGDGRYLWRDLIDIGMNESSEVVLNYPFLNGSHYMYDNYCFYVRRQDPFGHWGLFWDKFPSDPIGEHMTDKFTFNSSDDIC